jgi:signal transduction histidine kinase
VEPRNEQADEFGLGYPVASDVAQRIRAILSEAEAAAAALRHDAEQYAQRRRRMADEEAAHLMVAARREADDLIQERVRRLSELSDTLLSRAEGLLGRFDQAEHMRSQLAELTEALGRSAEQLAHEIEDREPQPAAPPVEPVERFEPPAARPQPEPEFEPVDAVVEPDPEPEPTPEPEPRDLRVVPDDGAHGTTEPADAQLAARLVALQMAVAGGNRSEVEGHLRRAFDLEVPDDILDDVFGPGTGPGTRVSWPEFTKDQTTR